MLPSVWMNTNELLRQAVYRLGELFERCLEYHNYPRLAERCLEVADTATETISSQWMSYSDIDRVQSLGKSVLALQRVEGELTLLSNDDLSRPQLNQLHDTTSKLNGIYNSLCKHN